MDMTTTRHDIQKVYERYVRPVLILSLSSFLVWLAYTS